MSLSTSFSDRIHIRNNTGDTVVVGDSTVEPYQLVVMKLDNPCKVHMNIQKGYILTSPFTMGPGPYILQPGKYYYIEKSA